MSNLRAIALLGSLLLSAASAAASSAPGPLAAAKLGDDAGWAPLLQRMLVTQTATSCTVAHPDMAEDLKRIHDGWMARNEQAMAVYDRRFAQLPKDRQKQVFDHFVQLAAEIADGMEQAEKSGQGEYACRTVFAAYDSTAPLVVPPEH